MGEDPNVFFLPQGPGVFFFWGGMWFWCICLPWNSMSSAWDLDCFWDVYKKLECRKGAPYAAFCDGPRYANDRPSKTVRSWMSMTWSADPRYLPSDMNEQSQVRVMSSLSSCKCSHQIYEATIWLKSHVMGFRSQAWCASRCCFHTSVNGKLSWWIHGT